MENLDTAERLQVSFEQNRAAFAAFVILQRQQRKHMGGSGFQFGNEAVHSPAKKGIENHGRDTNCQSGASVDQCFADSLGQQYISRSAKIRAERTIRDRELTAAFPGELSADVVGRLCLAG